jgi:peptidyl-prolyl cis-trans isomerase D
MPLNERNEVSMLDALRRGSTGTVAKILFAVLVVSFAIWGIGPVFRDFGRGSLAKVGDQDIRVEDFQRQLQNEIHIISRQTGRRLSMEEARTAGLDNRILAQLMAWAAVEQHAAQLDLALSNEALIEQLKKDPAFKGPDDKFSKFKFENVLNQMGLSERGFLKLRRRDELREQLTSALIDAIAVPDEMVDLVNAWREEKRVAEYFAIDAAKITVPEPDAAKVKATYEANKSRFTTPELRKLAILVLSIDSLKPKMDVSDAEIAESYEETKKDYNTPERRRVQQIAFKDKKAAEAAKKALDSGKKTFGDIAKDVGAKNTDIDLGLIRKDQLIDPKIADAAFSLDKDKISDVIEGRFATVLLRVSAIEPAVTRTLKDVKGEVRDKLAGKKAQAQLQNLIDQVEDNRAAGKPLKEIAEAMNVQYIEVPATDRFNKQPDADKPAIPLPDALSIVRTAFDSDVGLENEPVELRDGGYAWVDVLGVTPKKQKPFDEVKEDAKKLAIKNEREKRVSELANKLVERADKGESMEALAKEAGAPKLDTTPAITRSTEPQGLSKGAVKQIFTLTKGKAGSAPTTDGKSRSVFKVTKITPAPEPTKEQREKIAKELKEQLTDEALSEYVIALQDKLGANINQEEYRRAIGAETQ